MDEEWSEAHVWPDTDVQFLSCFIATAATTNHRGLKSLSRNNKVKKYKIIALIVKLYQKWFFIPNTRLSMRIVIISEFIWRSGWKASGNLAFQSKAQ